MTVLERGEIVYYIRDEAITVGIKNKQFIGYNVYFLQNRKPFYEFRKTLLESSKSEYGTIIEQIRLAQMFNLIATATTKPEIK